MKHNRCKWILPALALLLQAAAADKPNILFIAVDDLLPTLGCYGAEQIQSPNIDRLAGEGMVFERAYCQAAICHVSRASLMSGYYPQKNKMVMRKAMFEHVPGVLSLNQHFMNNGYETVNIGKIYHHPSDDSTGWTRDFRNLNEPWSRGYITESSLELERRGKGSRGPAYENADV
ncbi:MAG TPA: sulfatase-like hydrolase/transferase, partial [Tichowtungia sp.]|nr:sulfatase-like hydrolase/transferase [Tichowtungia sp.]